MEKYNTDVEIRIKPEVIDEVVAKIESVEVKIDNVTTKVETRIQKILATLYSLIDLGCTTAKALDEVDLPKDVEVKEPEIEVEVLPNSTDKVVITATASCIIA
jgi:hypothetical protein